MNNSIQYRPFRSHVWFSPFLLIAGILSFVGVGYCLPEITFPCFFLLCIGMVSIILAKALYDSSRTTVWLENDGLRIIEGKNNQWHFVLWKNFSYAYYIPNFKGHLFLILSDKYLNENQAKRFVNQRSMSSKIYDDKTIVIHIDVQQKTDLIKERINNTIPHINVYQD